MGPKHHEVHCWSRMAGMVIVGLKFGTRCPWSGESRPGVWNPESQVLEVIHSTGQGECAPEVEAMSRRYPESVHGKLRVGFQVWGIMPGTGRYLLHGQ